MTLAYLGRIAEVLHRLETPVGVVEVNLLVTESGGGGKRPAFATAWCRGRRQGLGTVQGDIAWGGNWFFLVEGSPLEARLENIPRLSAYAGLELWRNSARRESPGGMAVRSTTSNCSVRRRPPIAHGRSFVLCPGGAYDRSPCGTGTCKLACLAADGKLGPGQTWIQESVVGSTFQAQYRRLDDSQIVPTITGDAYVTAGSVADR